MAPAAAAALAIESLSAWLEDGGGGGASASTGGGGGGALPPGGGGGGGGLLSSHRVVLVWREENSEGEIPDVVVVGLDPLAPMANIVLRITYYVLRILFLR